jgi:hypothetical protein
MTQVLEDIFKVEFVRENDALKMTFESNIKSAVARAKEDFLDEGQKHIEAYISAEDDQFKSFLLQLQATAIENFKFEPEFGDETFFKPYWNLLSEVSDFHYIKM